MNNSLQKALPIVAGVYGQMFGVKVVVSGSDAYTDGTTIVVPNVDLSSKSEMFTNALWGFLTHEAAHVRLTDFGVFKTSPLIKSLLNILEDGRIENEFMSMYPGTRTTLGDTARYVFSGFDTTVDDEAGALFYFVLGWVRYNYLNQDAAKPVFEEGLRSFKNFYSNGALIKTNALLPKLSQCKSTGDCLELVNELIDGIQEAEEKEDEEKGDSSDSPDSGASGDDSDPDSGDDSDTEGDPSQGGSTDSSSDDGANTGESGQEGDQASSLDPDASDESGSGTISSMQKALTASAEDLPDDYLSEFKDEAKKAPREDFGVSVVDVNPNLATQRPLNGAEINSAKAMSNSIRKQLMGLIQAQARTPRRPKRAGKRPNTRSMHKLSVGDTRIYLRDQKRLDVNTAIHLMVDLSGSMNGGNDQVARESALAFAYALNTLKGVSVGVTFFGPSVVTKVLPQGSDINQHVGRFQQRAGGSTPAAEAVWSGSFDLIRAKADKRIGILITDGGPDSGTALNNVLSRSVDSGIEFIGIGVGSHSITKFIDNSIVINSVGELANQLFTTVKRTLIAA